ncbi:unnamed protein product [Brassica rapa subsp. trilocularis]
MPMSLILLHIKLNAFAKPKSVSSPVKILTFINASSNFHTTLLWKLEHEHQSELLKCLQEIVQIFVHASVHYCLSDFRHPPLANFTQQGGNGTIQGMTCPELRVLRRSSLISLEWCTSEQQPMRFWTVTAPPLQAPLSPT